MTRKHFTPRPMQLPMIAHGLDHPRCAIWAKPGTGKTSATFSILDALYLSGESHPTLVLAPLRVARRTWADEAHRWHEFGHLDVVPIVGDSATRIRAMKRDVPIYTTNYENLAWLAEFWGDRWPFRTVIADESTKLKSLRLSFQQARKKDGSPGKEFVRGQGGKRAKALGRIAHSHIKRFIELTGTPSPNGLQDLWGQLWFLDGGSRLGRTYEAFSQRWFRRSFDGYGMEAMPNAEAQIHEAVKDLCLTIDPKDYYDLRDPIVNVVRVDLSPAVMKLYREFEKEMFLQLKDRTVEAFGGAARTQKSLQLANGAVYVDPLADCDENPRAKEWREVHDEKILALEELIEEIGGDPVIVVYQFRSDLARLQKAFPQGRLLKTEQDEDDFKAGKIPVLFMQPQGASHGIDGFQTVCNQMVFFAQDWNLENHDQIVERIGPVRQMQAGLDRPVYLHYLVAANTVDELVVERRETKRSTQDILMEAAKRRGL